MCNAAVPGIPLHRYKRNWPITCDLSESRSVLRGAFHFCPVYFFLLYLVTVSKRNRVVLAFFINFEFLKNW